MTFLRSSLLAAAITTLIVSGIAVAGSSSSDSPSAKTSAAAKKRGARGKTGPAGPKGPAGPAGPKGADGAPGAKGADGVAGPKGADGAAGAKGATGATGPTGPQGEKGDKGDQGVQGVQGPQGVQGAQGPIGPSNAYTLLKHTTFGLTEHPEDTYVDIAKIENLPAGKYVATATLSALKRGGGTLIRCQIVAPGHHSPRRAVSVGETAGSTFASTITVSMPISLNSPFTLTLQCLKQYTAEPDKATYVENIEMQALKVGNLDARF